MTEPPEDKPRPSVLTVTYCRLATWPNRVGFWDAGGKWTTVLRPTSCRIKQLFGSYMSWLTTTVVLKLCLHEVTDGYLTTFQLVPCYNIHLYRQHTKQCRFRSNSSSGNSICLTSNCDMQRKQNFQFQSILNSLLCLPVNVLKLLEMLKCFVSCVFNNVFTLRTVPRLMTTMYSLVCFTSITVLRPAPRCGIAIARRLLVLPVWCPGPYYPLGTTGTAPRAYEKNLRGTK
jgi:hypothetical protein